MAQCKYCGKKGFFLRVSNLGLCDRCEAPILASVQSICKVINESLQLVDTSKNFNTRLSRLNVAINNYQIIYTEYWSRGIYVITNNPVHEINELNKRRSEIIEDEVHNLVEKHLDKANRLTTVKSKVSNANKALDELLKFKQEYNYENKELEYRINIFIHNVQYDDFILKAEKEEFKGNIKKAIDQYQEALFFLKKDDIPDDNQSIVISQLEAKIKSLQGN